MLRFFIGIVIPYAGVIGLLPWANTVPDGVLRAKGIVYLDGDARTPFSVHVVGRRVAVRPFPSAALGARSSLVFIGMRGCLERGAVEAALNHQP